MVQTNVKNYQNMVLQLREKQKLRYLYGMTERQFRNTFDIAGKKFGVHGENFMILLASRFRRCCLFIRFSSYSSSSTSIS